MSKEKINLKGKCDCGWVNFKKVTIHIPRASIHKATQIIKCEDCGKKVKISGTAQGK